MNEQLQFENFIRARSARHEIMIASRKLKYKIYRCIILAPHAELQPIKR